MKEEAENPEEEEHEPFSDDPEEQLRIENELLRLQLQAETGADIHELEDVPPEVENAFLNNILAFERQLDSLEEVSIYQLIGAPEDFRPAEELDDATLEKELERLVALLGEHHIEVDYGMDYPARTKYKFITEELFQHETQKFDIPDLVNHFIYEEFHPNHDLAIRGIAEEFLDMWLNREIDEDSYIFGKEFISSDNTIYGRTAVLNRIRHVFDAYLSFGEGSYELSHISYDEMNDGSLKGLGFADGRIRYKATLESKEVVQIDAPFKLYLTFVNGYWELINIEMPGLTL